MSILLDALRRSEEQRRLGSTPSIHADPGRGPAADDGAYQWIPLSLIALSAIVMAWIGWQQYQRPAELAPAAAPATSEQAAAGSEEAGPADESPAAETRPAITPAQRALRRSPVEKFTQSVESPQGHPDMESAQAALADARRAQVSESVQTYQAEREPGGEAQQPGESEGGREVLDSEPETPVRRTMAEDAAPERPASEPITYWELPQGVRDNLPELRITVLVYADRPEDRFLLVGGQRLVEKDEYEGGVVLDEIRRDGAVFLYRNYRFLVKG